MADQKPRLSCVQCDRIRLKRGDMWCKEFEMLVVSARGPDGPCGTNGSCWTAKPDMASQPPLPSDGDMAEIPHNPRGGYGRGDHEHDDDEIPGWLVGCVIGFIVVAVITVAWLIGMEALAFGY